MARYASADGKSLFPSLCVEVASKRTSRKKKRKGLGEEERVFICSDMKSEQVATRLVYALRVADILFGNRRLLTKTSQSAKQCAVTMSMKRERERC